MTRSADEIVRLFRERRNQNGPARARAMALEAVYEGRTKVPLPELDKNEQPAITNWLALGVDQLAMRVASVTPAIECPPLRPGFDGSEKNAKIRRRAITAWWQENGFEVQLSKRARWFVAYASAPALIRPDKRRGIPVWELRDPRSAYPAPNPDPAGVCPDDCIFAVKRTLGWIQSFYPAAARALDITANPNPDREFECLEYYDADEAVMLALGNSETSAPAPQYGTRSRQTPKAAPFVELMRFPNKIGRCPAVIPQRISLNMPRGQFDHSIGLYHGQARAMALWMVATDRAIFPDLWFISKPNEQVNVVKVADGRGGIPGEVTGGDLKEVSPVSAPQVQQMLEMMEQSQQRNSAVSPSLGGQMPSNVRTGKAGDQLMGETVDFFVQEAQRVLGWALSHENALAVETSREYFGEQKKTYYIALGRDKGAVDYVPARDFDSSFNIVAWPHAGSDVNSLVIGIGQRLGLGEISLRTARTLDPYVDDPDLEEERCTVESLDQALKAAINQAIVAGQIGPLEVLQLRQLVYSERKSLEEAFQIVHQGIQQQAQAQQMAMAGAAGGPGMGGPGGGMLPNGAAGGAPGLMAPGVAQQLGLPAGGNPPGGGVPAPQPGVAHAGQLMSALRPRNVGQ